MKPGDLVRIINWSGSPAYCIILRVDSVGVDGPSMDSSAMVSDGVSVREVWLYECEVVGELSDDREDLFTGPDATLSGLSDILGRKINGVPEKV